MFPKTVFSNFLVFFQSQLHVLSIRIIFFLFTMHEIVAQDATAVGADVEAMHSHPQVDGAVAKIRQSIQSGPFEADWESLEKYQIPQWYKDAKFGIFVHWGVYSVPAFGSEWYPRNMYIDQGPPKTNAYQHHIDTYGPQNKFGYKDFIPMFKAERFDADRWRNCSKTPEQEM